MGPGDLASPILKFSGKYLLFDKLQGSGHVEV